MVSLACIARTTCRLCNRTLSDLGRIVVDSPEVIFPNGFLAMLYEDSEYTSTTLPAGERNKDR
jgi:hypothetical protein